MTNRTWKRSEREIARRLGGSRIPVTGRRGPDVDHPLLAVEVKSRKKVPGCWKEWLAQAQAGAPDSKLPAVVVHELGGRHDADLVVMRLADFENLLRA